MYNFVHSFWTKPMQDKYKIQVNTYLFVLSALYIKKLGCNINLHTDSFGAKLLDGVPYTNTFTDLDNLDIDPILFAYPKSIVLQKEPIGTVHIDGDVLIKKKECIDKIFNHQCDCVLQSLEVINWDFEGNCLLGHLLSKHLLSTGERLDITNRDFNVGIIGFFNERLRNLYINNYQSLALDLLNDESYKIYLECKKDLTCPDLIFEQQLIYQLTKNYSTQLVIPLDSYNNILRNNIANNIGFAHVLGSTKYQDNNFNKIKQSLYNLDSNLYNKIEQNLKILDDLL